jgi:glycerol 3-phosphatase-2
LLRKGGLLIATGRDATFPMPDSPWPATGSIVAAVEVASGTRATVIGKPEAPMFEAAQTILGACRGIAVIGDGIGSDIEGGNRVGLTTVLVAAQLPTEPPPAQRPDAVVTSLEDLVEMAR